MNLSTDTPATDVATLPYEAPAIEQVVTLEELEREVHYAGSTAPSNVPAPL